MADFVMHVSCDACGSSDANALYSDGSTYCFACKKAGKGDASAPLPTPTTRKGPVSLLPIPQAEALSKRNLSYDTTKRWRYGYAEMNHPTTGVLSRCQVATYFDLAGHPVAQKIRFGDKSFLFLGGSKTAPLYGMHLWKDGGKRVVVTEGEIDAMSVDQAMNHKWPVVSVPNGASAAKASIAHHIEYLNKFDEVVLMFDNDEPGRLATEECAALFPPGKVKIGVLPVKDPNEMLQAGRVTELQQAVWDAKAYRPDGILRVADLGDSLFDPVKVGLPWPWESLTKATYGRRRGELYGFGAGTGVGKTDVFTEIIAQTIKPLDEGGLDLPVGLFMLEQIPKETIRRTAGKIDERRYHIPNAGWTDEQYKLAIGHLMQSDKMFLYNSFGATDWDQIKSRIRFLVLNYGVKDIFLDHLTALAAAEEDERVALEKITSEMSGLAQELDFSFYFISHLATPEGKPHEEGGRVMIRHFKGSRAIGFWSHFLFGLERNQQAEDPIERKTTTFRVLKDRYTGNSVGTTFHLVYNETTGTLREKDTNPFADETQPDQPKPSGDF